MTNRLPEEAYTNMKLCLIVVAKAGYLNKHYRLMGEEILKQDKTMISFSPGIDDIILPSDLVTPP